MSGSLRMKHIIATGCLVMGSNALAADADQRRGFWGALDIGVGNVSLAQDIAGTRSDTHLYLGAAGGYTLHPQVQLGLEMSGWNIESGNLWNLADSDGLSTLFAVVRLWPAADSRLLLKLAGGDIIHGSRIAGGVGTGSGYTIGIGYELARYADRETHWFISYSAGHVTDYTPHGGVAQNEDFRLLTTGLSFGF